MIANGYDVAVMEHHTSSSGGGFTNAYSQARISYLGISTIPNSFFDGITNVSGGSSGTYSQFLTKYNQRKAVLSNFTIAMNGDHSGLNYTVMLTMEKVSSYSGTNLIAHLALTESNRSYGGDIFNHITRLFVPSANGTPVNFTSNPIQSVVLNFSINSGWVLNELELIAFLQDNSTKEILQAIKLPLNDLLPMATDAELVSVYNVPVESCSGKASPYLKIKNKTTNNLAAASIKYKINQGALQTYNWSGNLGYNQEAYFQLPQMAFIPQPNNLFTAYVHTSNGTLDPNPLNDTVTKNFINADSYKPLVKLEIKTDNFPTETNWQVLNSQNQVIYSGGPYSGFPNTVFNYLMTFGSSDCYRFVINDSGNNGICCSNGNGYFQIINSENQLIYEGGNFGPAETFEMELSGSIINAYVFLEGAADPYTWEMNTQLNIAGIIPTSQPYNIPPWNYSGNESVVSIPNQDVVDWVLVELRETTGGPETATSQTILTRQAAFVLRNGQIVGRDGANPLVFQEIINNNLFLVIWHRNHVGIMSNYPLPSFGGSNYYYDFSEAESQVYGGNLGYKDVGLGMLGMASGDADGDGLVGEGDKSGVWNLQTGKTGYNRADFNMNKHINNQDKNEFLYPNYLMESQVPD